MTINLFQNNALSFKSVLNQHADDKLLRTTQRLSQELNILRNRDVALEVGKITNATQLPSETVVNTQQDFIDRAIQEIINIRESLGITDAAGQNTPLEDLFQINKGKIVDQEL